MTACFSSLPKLGKRGLMGYGGRMGEPLTIFVYHSSEDEDLVSEFLVQLSALKRAIEDVEIWAEPELGDDHRTALEDALKRARIALILVSPSMLEMLANDAAFEDLLQQRINDGMTAIPIILKPCLWDHDPLLSGLPPLPRNGEPIATLSGSGPTNALAKAVRKIAEIVRSKSNAGDWQRSRKPRRANAPVVATFAIMGAASGITIQLVGGGTVAVLLAAGVIGLIAFGWVIRSVFWASTSVPVPIVGDGATVAASKTAGGVGGATGATAAMSAQAASGAALGTTSTIVSTAALSVFVASGIGAGSAKMTSVLSEPPTHQSSTARLRDAKPLERVSVAAPISTFVAEVRSLLGLEESEDAKELDGDAGLNDGGTAEAGADDVMKTVPPELAPVSDAEAPDAEAIDATIGEPGHDSSCLPPHSECGYNQKKCCPGAACECSNGICHCRAIGSLIFTPDNSVGPGDKCLNNADCTGDLLCIKGKCEDPFP